MSGRKSDDDIRKYLPDLDSVLRTADPAAAKERRRAALAEIDGEHGEHAEPEGEDEETTNPHVVGAGAAASPWAGAGAGAIDKAALPSALMPGVAPPVTTPIPIKKEEETRRVGAFPGWLKGVAAVIGVLGPVVVLLLLQNLPSSKGKDRGDGTTAALTSTGAGVVSAAVPVKSAVGVASSPEVGSAAVPVVPPEASSAVVPVAPPAAGSVAPPVAPGVPGPTSGGQARKPPVKTQDPYDAAPPGSSKTATPSSIPKPPPGPVPMFEREQ